MTPDLDAFFYDGLPSELSSSSVSSSTPNRRHPIAALTPEQLARVVEWKLARGTWRPRLLDFARAAKEGDVAAAAEAAAEALSSSSSSGEAKNTTPPPPSLEAVGRAIDALSELKGVGPATATALLSAADPSVPFLSDEAGAAVLGSREYSRPAALKVTSALRERAAELNREEGKEKGSLIWTARSVERALWSASRAADDDADADDDEAEQGEAEKKEAKGETKDKENATTAPATKRRKR